MLIAVFSDPHGNLPALEAVLKDARRRGAELFVCAGDMTGYGPLPEGVCKLLIKEKIPAISGNYDEKVVEARQGRMKKFKKMPSKKRLILSWTAENITKSTAAYLARLPRTLELDLPSGKKALVVHGSPLSADDAVYPSITSKGLGAKLAGVYVDVLIAGHTHIPFVKRVGKVLVVNCGSAGHPVDGDPRPSYALINAGDGGSVSARIIRFKYGVGRTVEALKKTPLPKALQRDFAEGSKKRFS